MLFNGITIVFAMLVAAAALVAVFQQKNIVGTISYRSSSAFGKGEVLFTPVVIISLLGFYQGNLGWMFAIAAFWIYAFACSQ